MEPRNDLIIRQILGFVRGCFFHGSSELRVSAPGGRNTWCEVHMRAALPYVVEFDPTPITRASAADTWTDLVPDPAFSLAPNQGLVLNREYKPLGVPGQLPLVAYSQWPCVAALPEGSSFLRGSHGSNRVHPLYQDSSPPWESMRYWRAYEAKLRTLLADLGAPSDVGAEVEALTKAWSEK
ncbi:hypothetical protein OV203_01600 [Nannocystis sp. ILAH1]|uniref:hypothetical protein n=1 Tax=Nannocystis sp. ILAH1 TaxID=2996789 RepID=UPI00226E49CA|nr:hypothetical protein [Nannocystis sp. ILAH1]MCY0985806.1 hypothetical protein [Nannocystis sp. ILAH1]